MILALFPALVAVIGALVYGLSANAKVAEIGRIAFFVGLLWAVYGLAGHVVRIG